MSNLIPDSVKKFYREQVETYNELVAGGTEIVHSVFGEAVLVIAIEIINFIGYTLSTQILETSYSPKGRWTFREGVLRIAGALIITALRYGIQDLEVRTYMTARDRFLNGCSKVTNAVMKFRALSLEWENEHHLLTRMIQVAMATVILWSRSKALIAATIVGLLIFSRHSPFRLFEPLQKFKEYKENHPDLVQNALTTVKVAQYSLPILSLIAYKTIGGWSIPVCFIPHFLAFMAIPLTELEIQLSS